MILKDICPFQFMIWSILAVSIVFIVQNGSYHIQISGGRMEEGTKTKRQRMHASCLKEGPPKLPPNTYTFIPLTRT